MSTATATTLADLGSDRVRQVTVTHWGGRVEFIKDAKEFLTLHADAEIEWRGDKWTSTETAEDYIAFIVWLKP